MLNYVGELQYDFDGKSLNYSFSMDETGARQYVKSRFPEVGERFEFVPMRPMRVSTNFCDPKVLTIPIYLPRPK